MSFDVAARRLRWPAFVAWALGWAGMFALDDRLDLANKALVLVLSAALAAPWSGPWTSLLASAAAVLAFNFAFVPPRGRFAVDLHQHALLLATLLAVSWIVALLMTRLRHLAAQATVHAQRSDQLRSLGDALRAADGPAAQAAALQPLLVALGGAPATLLLPAGEVVGTATADEAAGLRLCLQDGRAMGPGTGRHEEQPAWYLPLRGRQGTHGAALLRLADAVDRPADVLAHAQALCDQLGTALERAAALQAAGSVHEQAQTQALRNTLLSAIAHDHRTPLATIVGAASALHDQGDRLTAAQRQRLAATIVDEAEQLTRLTDNTLQLARLGAVGEDLPRDWESVEEMVGTVLRRVRQRDPGRRTRARVEPQLPLLRCNAVLMVQALDNLVDNALKHGGGDTPVELLARRIGEQLMIAVRDRGPGVPPAQRERIFDSFRQGEGADRGAGVGLALCRAVAQAHGGELRLRPRGHGGASFELWLPTEAAPT
jgi:two-component system sensor histidine kinase KdpD